MPRYMCVRCFRSSFDQPYQPHKAFRKGINRPRCKGPLVRIPESFDAGEYILGVLDKEFSAWLSGSTSIFAMHQQEMRRQRKKIDKRRRQKKTPFGVR